jgi:hypothetical protein
MGVASIRASDAGERPRRVNGHLGVSGIVVCARTPSRAQPLQAPRPSAPGPPYRPSLRGVRRTRTSCQKDRRRRRRRTGAGARCARRSASALPTSERCPNRAPRDRLLGATGRQRAPSSPARQSAARCRRLPRAHIKVRSGAESPTLRNSDACHERRAGRGPGAEGRLACKRGARPAVCAQTTMHGTPGCPFTWRGRTQASLARLSATPILGTAPGGGPERNGPLPP